MTEAPSPGPRSRPGAPRARAPPAVCSSAPHTLARAERSVLSFHHQPIRGQCSQYQPNIGQYYQYQPIRGRYYQYQPVRGLNYLLSEVLEALHDDAGVVAVPHVDAG